MPRNAVENKVPDLPWAKGHFVPLYQYLGIC